MPNVASVLKAEIARIARREARAAVTPLRRPSVRARRDVADLKRRLAVLEKANRDLQARVAKVEASAPAPAAQTEEKGWISGKGVKSLRRRLGLSRADFAKLVGVSSNAVYIWETRAGMLKLRKATRAAVFAVRGIGAREARQRLAEMTAAKATSTKSSRQKPKKTK